MAKNNRPLPRMPRPAPGSDEKANSEPPHIGPRAMPAVPMEEPGCQLLRRAGGDGVSSARDGAGGARGAIAASCRGIVISSLLRARSERVIFRSSGSGVGAELLDSSMERGIIPQSREIIQAVSDARLTLEPTSSEATRVLEYTARN